MDESASLIRSVQDAHDQAWLTVRGDIDREVTDKLRHHLHALLRGHARFIVVDLTAVRHCDPHLLSLLSWTQRRLSRRMGMISVVGLHPNTLLDDLAEIPDPVVADGHPPVSKRLRPA
jgi:ABC-type transporter Mla MlaB component